MPTGRKTPTQTKKNTKKSNMLLKRRKRLERLTRNTCSVFIQLEYAEVLHNVAVYPSHDRIVRTVFQNQEIEGWPGTCPMQTTGQVKVGPLCDHNYRTSDKNRGSCRLHVRNYSRLEPPCDVKRPQRPIQPSRPLAIPVAWLMGVGPVLRYLPPDVSNGNTDYYTPQRK